MNANRALQKLARDFGARDIDRTPLDPARSRAIAAAYETAVHSPEDWLTVQAYAALNRETLAQFWAVKETLHLEIEPIREGMPSPYATSTALHADVARGHLWYYPTALGFGPVGNVRGHLLLNVTEVRLTLNAWPYWSGPLLANDVFRIVHDLFGHCAESNGFGPAGEELAWRLHSQLYSPLAARAVTSETRGQNSWVNFGPHAEWNRHNPRDTRYAEQKMTLLPEWCSEI